jgi:threonine/homoserine/homoserine lactone efflux protein
MTSVAVVIGVMGLVNLPSIALWAGFGVALGRRLKTPGHWRLFNLLMGALTAGCVSLILL